MHFQSSVIVASLVVAAFLAGLIDAIAGGGGLLTLPALLAAGLPPHLALGTNKAQAVAGSSASLLGFTRARLIDRRRAPTSFAGGLLGSFGGAFLVLQIAPDVLRPIVLTLLVAVAVFLAARPRLHAGPPRVPPRWEVPASVALALVVGTYDGFFGPGTGTFLIIGYVFLLGHGLTRASAEAKVVNFGSSVASFGVFAATGNVAWHLALPMAGAQIFGGLIGSQVAIRGGDRLVRWVLLCVVVALVVQLGHDGWKAR